MGLFGDGHVGMAGMLVATCLDWEFLWDWCGGFGTGSNCGGEMRGRNALAKFGLRYSAGLPWIRISPGPANKARALRSDGAVALKWPINIEYFACGL
jgi:hypothetical protein